MSHVYYYVTKVHDGREAIMLTEDHHHFFLHGGTRAYSDMNPFPKFLWYRSELTEVRPATVDDFASLGIKVADELQKGKYAIPTGGMVA